MSQRARTLGIACGVGLFLYGFAGYFNFDGWEFRGAMALGIILVVATLLWRSN